MINFHDIVERLGNYQNKKIKDLIFRNNIVNYQALRVFTEDFKYRHIIDESIKKPIFNSLYEVYRNQKDINNAIDDIHLFISIYDTLVEKELIVIEQVESNILKRDKNGLPINFNPFPNVTVINENGINELKRQVRKEFAFLMLFNIRIQFLISLLDEICQKGPFNQGEILKIKSQLEKTQEKIDYKFGIDYHSEENTKKQSLQKTKNNGLNTTNIETIDHKMGHKTYYLDVVRDQPFILKANNEILEAFQVLKKNSLINPETSLENFKRIFQHKALEENQLIQWTGTLIELKWLIQQICQKGICSHLKGIDKWMVATHCFLIKVKGNWVKIEKFTKISNANGSPSKKSYIGEFGKKIASIR